MRIHREGYPTLAFTAGVLFIFNRLAARQSSRLTRGVVFGLSLGLWGFLARFFRNPYRVNAAPEGCILAPADGKVIAVERVYEPEYFCDERLKISIYMSALNVHINRIPINGKLVYARYHPGKYLVAFHPKASELNERNTSVIEAANGAKILVRQIAGMLARRIVFYPQIGEVVQAGDELGFIKFGSRCDLYLPIDSQIFARLDQTVIGGETILALCTSK
jgi:phosphatidylserine decarboxylase